MNLVSRQQRQACVFLLHERGQRDGWQPGGIVSLSADLADEIEAIVLWHTQIAHQHLWQDLNNCLHRLAKTSGRCHNGARLSQHHHQNVAGVGIVVHD
jgi:hypothetical protein